MVGLGVVSLGGVADPARLAARPCPHAARKRRLDPRQHGSGKPGRYRVALIAGQVPVLGLLDELGRDRVADGAPDLVAVVLRGHATLARPDHSAAASSACSSSCSTAESGSHTRVPER